MALKCSSRYLGPVSIYSQTTPYARKSCFCQKWSCRQETPLSMRNSFFSLTRLLNDFPDMAFLYQFIAISLLLEENQIFVLMELQTGTPFFVRNVVLACSSASDMQHYFTVLLYTTWRHPCLSFVYQTSLTFRWLKR
jgi:hypothetical protein